MTALRQSVAVAAMVTRGTWRRPMILISIALLPASFFLIFWLIGGMALGRHVLLGTLVAFAHNAGIVSLPQLIISYKYRKLQDMFVATPIHPLTYMAGMALSRLLYAGPNLLVVVAVALVSGALPPSALPSVLGLLFISWLVGSLIGFTVATYFTNPLHISVLANLLGTLLVAIPPVLYPLDLIPLAPLRWAALAVPAAAAAQSVRLAAGVATALPAEQWALWSILAGYVVLCTLLVVRGSRWREV